MSELSINERLQKLENEIAVLKKRELREPKELKELKELNTKKEKKPREKTAYNIFMSEFISQEKERLGSDFKHKEAFTDGAKKWQEKKLHEIKK